MQGKKWILLGSGHCLHNLFRAVNSHIHLVTCQEEKMGRGRGKCWEFYTAASSCSDLYRPCLPLPASSFLSNVHPKKCRPANLKDKIHTVGTCFTVMQWKSNLCFYRVVLRPHCHQTLSTSDLWVWHVPRAPAVSQHHGSCVSAAWATGRSPAVEGESSDPSLKLEYFCNREHKTAHAFGNPVAQKSLSCFVFSPKENVAFSK